MSTRASKRLAGSLRSAFCSIRAAGIGIAAICVLATCSALSGTQRQTSAVLPKLTWPQPPLQARIELAGVFDRASALGIQPSLSQRLADLIGGRDEPRMVRPAGVAASEGRVAVADPGSNQVFLFDLQRHRAVVLERCGKLRLGLPVAVALVNGRVYVSDAGLSRVHIFDADGGCTGGWPLADGSRPAGIGVDPDRGRIYVADSGLHQVLIFDRSGTPLGRFGQRGKRDGQFNFPGWLAVDESGTLYVTDTLNFRVQVLAPNGNPISTFGRQGDASGDVARPKGIGVGRDGVIYVVDALFDAVQMFDREGRYLMAFGSRGIGPGQLWLPSDLAVDGDRIYVADSYNGRVQIFRSVGGGQ